MTRRRLSKRQIERIRAIQERRRERLANRPEQALADCEAEIPPEEGLVVVRHGASLVVEDHAGELHLCVARQHLGHPVCGDRVVWQRGEPGRGLVSAILERQTVLSRPDYSGRDKPIAANLTRLAVLIAPEPEPSGYLVDQYLVAAEGIGVEPMLVATKMDLLDAPARAAFEQRYAHYCAIGYRTLWISLEQPETLAPLVEALRDQTSILVGQSGVGKSSLVKALLPDRDIQVGRLSAATGLGRHTTSAASCYRLPGGGVLIDSPGVRSFRLGAIGLAELQWGFREFRPHLGGCRFANCRHDQEPGCAIRAAVERGEIAAARLDNFHHLARGVSA
ncbi:MULTISPECIES: ribosome small subunit-dependent GTPase A [Marichromatium]|uniref:Small ribosomal subunit biogenesis GTPase RsgA n=1 Tax=Marichromatium gracile TaxID=1048 RepID=A0A4R4AB56_MARGR|nr:MULTISPECIES: ribosome small subunit-dependent GTPase A [Marichromatium]MBK1709330.1 ribosome small subunit-dependent GTPase A [Marichromatium gracile]MBO8085864.1 ribosome small subunit-dependent GTPase A [Marichromatium sp.]RNE88530.1 ribosome small subunit-dependent GTPase A [Marichromatium sp. AB31]TCW36232.1 ribosome biogenesis GTPase [Marichromatium gracile]